MERAVISQLLLATFIDFQLGTLFYSRIKEGAEKSDTTDSSGVC